MRMKWMPRDVVALAMIGGGVFLKWSGYNGTVDMMLMLIAGFYFGAELVRERVRGNAKK